MRPFIYFDCARSGNWYNRALETAATDPDISPGHYWPCGFDCSASVVELVDTPDSKSGSREGVTVQVRPLVPSLKTSNSLLFLQNAIEMQGLLPNFTQIPYSTAPSRRYNSGIDRPAVKELGKPGKYRSVAN